LGIKDAVSLPDLRSLVERQNINFSEGRMVV
jgi:hypothetical protein